MDIHVRTYTFTHACIHAVFVIGRTVEEGPAAANGAAAAGGGAKETDCGGDGREGEKPQQLPRQPPSLFQVPVTSLDISLALAQPGLHGGG